jgi:methyltransferase (TIGR00027 family)
MADPLIQNVSDTAFMVAAYRAMESARPDALFHDPLAAKLAGARGRRIAEDMSGAFMAGWLAVIRTRIIDDFVLGAVARGADAALNLGAGLDARPYRMALPDALHWIEADFPRMIEYKESVLAGEKPVCRLERVKADLSDPAARGELLDTVGKRFKNVLVITEGVIPYLSDDDAGSLASDLRARPWITGWVADYFSPETRKYRKRAGVLAKMKNAPFLFEPADYFGFFAGRGWTPKEIRWLPEEGEKLGRPVPLPPLLLAWALLRGLFMSRERREAYRKFAAYVLFEPASARAD